jgi:hypothetical protein
MNVKLPGHRPGASRKGSLLLYYAPCPVESGAYGAHPGQSPN